MLSLSLVVPIYTAKGARVNMKFPTQIILNMYIPILLLFIFAMGIFVLKKALYQITLKKLSKAGIGDIDRMSGRVFEQYLEAIFARKGCAVKRTPYRGDFGGDLIVSSNGKRTVVQAKRWKRNVGVKAVQEAVAAKGYYGSDEAIVVTNSTFTPQAKELAGRNNVGLWNRKRLLDELIDFAGGDEGKTTVALSANDRAVNHLSCLKCGKRLTPKETDYCSRHSMRFNGKSYCYSCQRAV
jgi:restriction system protein